MYIEASLQSLFKSFMSAGTLLCHKEYTGK